MARPYYAGRDIAKGSVCFLFGKVDHGLNQAREVSDAP